MRPRALKPSKVNRHVVYSDRKRSAATQIGDESIEALTGQMMCRLSMHKNCVAGHGVVLPGEESQISLMINSYYS